MSEGTPQPKIYTDHAGVKHLDFGVISADLDELLTALENKLERDASRTDFLALSYFVPCAKIVRNTWKTIQYFCSDKPADLSRKREFALSAAPLNRSTLDMIFNAVFVLEDVEARFPWFAKAGWRELKIDDQRLRADFGDVRGWSDWLDAVYRPMIESGIKTLGLTPEEIADPRSITPWPNPGAMPVFGIKKDEPLPHARRLLLRLNEIFYADLSQQAHSSFLGLVKRGSYFAASGATDEKRDAILEGLRQEQIFTGLTLLFLFASVLDEAFNLGLDAKIRYLWTLVGEQEERTNLVYRIRYEGPLFPTGNGAGAVTTP